MEVSMEEPLEDQMEVNHRLRPTLMSLAQTNTDLDQALDELDVMGKAYLQLAQENAMLK